MLRPALPHVLMGWGTKTLVLNQRARVRSSEDSPGSAQDVRPVGAARVRSWRLVGDGQRSSRLHTVIVFTRQPLTRAPTNPFVFENGKS